MQLTQTDFKCFTEIAYEHSGIRIGMNKMELMTNRLGRRLKKLNLGSYEAYYRYLMRKGDEELNHFIKAITTNETFFFRCPAHFSMLGKEIFPKLPGPDLNIWSAACSTGEEPYSLAITVAERLKTVNLSQVNIYASDIDLSVLEKAHEGIYNEYALRLVPPDLKKKYFREQLDGTYRIIPRLRQMVKFGNHNLKSLFPKGKVDIIFCRNVLIYFDNMSKRNVSENLIGALKQSGYLFLGESEIVPDWLEMERINSSVGLKP